MPGEPSTRRGRASRERIVERAADLFAERGIAGTSVDDVLEAAKAGKGQFYHYFRNRDELVPALLDRAHREAIGGVLDRETAELVRNLRGRPDVARLLTEPTCPPAPRRSSTCTLPWPAPAFGSS